MIDIRNTNHLKVWTLVCLLALALPAATAGAHGDEDHSKDSAKASESTEALEFTGDPYPLSFCVVTGDELDAMGGPVPHVHEDRHLQFCCDSCKEEFVKNPGKWIEKIDREILEQQIGSYPLETCPVSGEKLGSMGPAVNIVVANRLVRLCCGGCEKAVRANPAKFIEQIDTAAADAQREAYPLETCVVSGEKLGGAMGDPVEIVYAGRLVRLCCESCKKPFNETPHTYLKKLDEAETGS